MAWKEYKIRLSLEIILRKLSQILICLIFISLSSCNLPTETTETTSDPLKSFAFGTWNCSYLENGFYAAVPLTMNQDGTAEFQYKQGTWTFDSQTNTFTFSPDVPIQNALYSSGTQTLELTLAAGQTVGGNSEISCSKP